MPTNEKSDECLEFKDCAACTKNAKCGWCSMEEKCVAGDNIAPFYTMCNFYNYLYCAGECARYVDCDVFIYIRKVMCKRYCMRMV